MKKSILCIIIFLSTLFIYFNCNGDLLEEGPDEETSSTTTLLEIKLRGIWMVGGLSGSAISTTVASVDLYDPLTGNWYTSVTSLPTPVSFASYTMSNGKIYVIGGFESTGTVSNAVQIYDVASDSWASGVTSGFSSRANIGSFMYGGNIYIIGGTTGNAAVAWAATANVVQKYSISGNSWSTLTPTISGYSERYGVVFNDVLYHMGGRSAAATLIVNAAANYIHEGYSVVNNAITSTTEIIFTGTAATGTRTGQATVIYQPSGGAAKIIIIGGFGGVATLTNITGNYIFQYSATPTTPALNTCYFLNYPFTQGTWTAFTNNYAPAMGFAAAAISGSNLYVFGGATSYNSGGLTSCNTIDLTGLPGNSWTAITSMTTGRFGHGAVINQ